MKKIFISSQSFDEFQGNFQEKCHLDNKSRQKSGLHPLSRKHNSGKPQRESN